MTITNGAVALRDGHEIAAQAAALAIRPGQEFWTDKQRAALAVLGIKGATNADLAVFMHYCQKTGLDPFSRQIYGIMRRERVRGEWVEKFTIQTGIDGFRVIRDRVAARLGVDVGYEDTIWFDADGREHTVWLLDTPPAACRVVVLKNGKPFPAVLRTAAYMATNADGAGIAQWRTQPEHMIEKCCEAFALRRAFPNDLGGLYIDEEMATAAEPAQQYQRVTVTDITAPAVAELPPEPPDGEDQGEPYHGGPAATTAKLRALHAKFGELGFTKEEREDRLAAIARLAGLPGLDSTNSLRQSEAQAVLDKLKHVTDRDGLIAELVKADQDASDA